MPCQVIEIDDAVGETAPIGIPGQVVVTGRVSLGCEQTETVYVWLSVADGRATGKVQAEFEINSQGRRTGDWTAVLTALHEPRDLAKKSIIECGKSPFMVHAQCFLDQRSLCSTEALFDELWCCPWVVTLEVTRDDGTLLVSNDGVYQNLPPGRYHIRIVEPDPPSPSQPSMDYCWYVNNQLDSRTADREFTYTLESLSVQISAKVTQQGCQSITGSVTLALPAPVECPQDIHIYERLTSADCIDGMRSVDLEGQIQGALPGMQLAWDFGDGTPTLPLEIRPQDIDASGVASLMVTHNYPAPGEYLVTLTVLDALGATAPDCPQGVYELRLKPCDTTSGPFVPPGREHPPEGPQNPACPIVLFIFAIAFIALIGLLSFSICIPILLYGVIIALVIMIIAIIFAATSCNRCSIFRALSWALLWAIIIAGLPGTFGCPLTAVPLASILAFILGIVVMAINRIEGCKVPGLFDFPFSFSQIAPSKGGVKE